MRAQIIALVIILSGIALLSTATSFALTTDELVQLKKAGISEDIILFMLDADYKDVGKVLKLKEVGFKDDTILSIIKNDLKGEPSSEIKKQDTIKDVFVKSGDAVIISKIKILWYTSFKSGPVLQSSQAVNNAKIVATGPESLRFEWEDKGLLDMIFKSPFKSPFYWDINKDDTLGPGKDGYAYTLKATVNHKGKPETDGSHYWVVYLDTKDTKIIDFIKQSLSIK